MARIQRLVEERGIRTASIMHLPDVAGKSRPPRMLTVKAPLGLTFGDSFEKDKQMLILKELLDFAVEGGAEEYRPSAYN